MDQKDMKDNLNVHPENQNDINQGPEVNTEDNMNFTASPETVQEELELEKLQKELEALKDKHLRAIAEFDNFKRRTARERMELIQTAGKEVITDLLEVLDDCERAKKEMENGQDVAAVKDGVMLVFNKLQNKLSGWGLKPMESMNHDFNPELHEAITEIPADSKTQKGKVVAEVEKGYYLNEKIIRYAKVVVGK